MIEVVNLILDGAMISKNYNVLDPDLAWDILDELRDGVLASRNIELRYGCCPWKLTDTWQWLYAGAED
jgi:hypothetical protein